MSTEANPPPPMPGNPNQPAKPVVTAPAAPELPRTLAATIDMLLKKPHDLLWVLAQGNAKAIALRLGIVALPCLLIVGLVIGLFSGGMQLWAAPVKIILGLSVAGVMCLPSLYIFSCLAGLRAGFSTLLGVMAGMLALTALLLAGFAPVLWIFGQSTESLGFMGVLTLLIWGIAGSFGLGLLKKAETFYGATGGSHLSVWLLIFTLVALQMSTALRPILGPGEETTFLPEKKMFFLEHWLSELGESGSNSTQRSKR